MLAINRLKILLTTNSISLFQFHDLSELLNILEDEKNYFPIASKSSNPRILQNPDNTV